MLKYMAKIFMNEDGLFQVSFPDFEGIITWGETLEEAQKMAKEALSGHVGVFYISRGELLPKPSILVGKDVYEIVADMSVLFAFELKKARLDKGYTQEQLATKLGYKQPSYNKLENPNRSNPTMQKIQELSLALGVDLLVFNNFHYQ